MSEASDRRKERIDATKAEMRRHQDIASDFISDPFGNRHRLRDMLWHFLIGCVVLGVSIAISPEINVSSWIQVPFAVLLQTILSAALRPLMIRIAVPLGWVGTAFLAFFSNFIVIYLAIRFTPGIEHKGPWQIMIVTWIYAVILAIVQWVLAADDNQAFVINAIRQSTRSKVWGSQLTEGDKQALADGSHPTLGVVFVQLDGMPAPVLEWAVKSGNFPTLSRWIRSGDYSWAEWHARIPSTTPVSQAGLLHGSSENIPAFRWYDKSLGRLIVANHPPDAALIEARLSNGRGLLADEGVSISNLFSGDAPTSLLVMSSLSKGRSGLGSSSTYASFFAHPEGFSRAFVLTVGEMIKEKYQARIQRRKGIEPRISRHGSYVFLRGVTNVLLRDLNTSLVIDSMMKGVKSIYVDYVDYDEIAHHAGVQRPESLRALEGLDEVLFQLERVVRYAPRPYRFVCVSDHGQSQGSTFKQRYGEPLEDVVRDLMGIDTADVAAATGSVEAWGPVNVFLSDLQQQNSLSGGLTRTAMRGKTSDGTVQFGPGVQEHEQASTEDGVAAEVVVIGSGNLGGIWFPRHEGRLTAEDIETQWPGLLAGLSTHEGVSFLMVKKADGEDVVMSRDGVRWLQSDRIEGTDPLEPFDRQTREDLLRVSAFADAPDIYLNSMYDVQLGEVAAFEELVGCHGGVGGWQTRAMVVHPTNWPIEERFTDDQGRLVGAESVHRQFVSWLEQLGHRGDLTVAQVTPKGDEPLGSSQSDSVLGQEPASKENVSEAQVDRI